MTLIAGLLGVVCQACLSARGTATSAGYLICGRVLGSDGVPVPDAGVVVGRKSCVDTRDAIQDAEVRTGADGRFKVQIREEDVDALIVGAKDRLSVRIDLGELTYAALSAGQWDVGDLVLDVGVPLRGVVRSRSGQGLGGVRVVARDRQQQLSGAHWDWPGLVWYQTRGITDAQGRFDLIVSASGVAVTVDANGYYLYDEPFVLPDGPLSIVLTQGGSVEGVLVDRFGVPCEGLVEIEYEVGGTQHCEASSNGSFRINLEYPHRYRLRGRPRFGPDNTDWLLLEGASSGVRLGAASHAVSVAPARAIGLLAVDKRTGTPVPGVEAAASWRTDDVSVMSGPSIEMALLDHARRSSEAGRILIPGPGEHDSRTGTIIVKAAGYAPSVIRGVQWSDEGVACMELRVEMVAESGLCGVVVDTDGRPIAGAMVEIGAGWSGASWFSGRVDRRALGQHVTSDDGTFRIQGLTAGRYELHARVWGRPAAAAMEVELDAATVKVGIRLVVPGGATLKSAIVGWDGLPAGSVLQIQKKSSTIGDREIVWRGYDERCAVRRAPVELGAWATFEGLSNGEYSCDLYVPHRAGAGGWSVIRLGSLDVGQQTVTRQFRVRGDPRARIEGHVLLTGAPIPHERLFVAVVDERLPFPLLCEPLRPDGTFDLRVSPGTYRVEVVDAVTCAVLAVELAVKAEVHEAAHVTMEQEIALSRVRLEAEPPGGPIVASRLGFEVHHGDAVTSHAGWQARQGWVSLADGRTEVEMLTPALPVTFRIWSATDSVLDLHPDSYGPPEAVINEVLVERPIQTIVLRVPKARAAQPGSAR